MHIRSRFIIISKIFRENALVCFIIMFLRQYYMKGNKYMIHIENIFELYNIFMFISVSFAISLN